LILNAIHAIFYKYCMRIFDVINLIENGVHLDEYRAQESDWEIRNYHKLDVILVKLCELVVKGQRQDPDTHGMVAAAILDPDNRLVSSTGRKIRGKWHHAERCAMMKYEQLHGDIPNGSICITTCSPCSERMGDRYEESCTDLINRSNIHKVYAGYDDPTQPEEQRHFNIIETSNPAIRAFCHQLAESFMDWEAQQASDSLSETWSKKYKRSINCKNPRGFSQRAHCAARKKRQRHALTKSKSVRENLEHDDVENQNLPSVNQAKALMPQILAKAQKIYDDWDESDRDTYAGGGICHIIADGICDVLGQTGIDCTPVSCSMEQHVYVVAKFDEGIYEIDIPYHVYEQGGGYSWTKIPDIKFETGDVKFQKLSGDPDEWENYIDENFADGKGPGRPGDSRRHGIPKNATMAQLQKAAKAPGRKGQLARWQINMRRGHSKK